MSAASGRFPGLFPIRYTVLVLCAVGTITGLGAALAWGGWWWLLPLVLGALSAVGVQDLRQTRHAVLRNYPVIGHMRFMLEFIRPEIRQYFIEGDHENLPFSRAQRSLVYQRSKGVSDSRPFGTLLDVSAPGYEWVNHSMVPTKLASQDFRTWIGGTPGQPLPGAEVCTQPYHASVFNISAMSFGALSANAVLALNLGARTGGFAHDTGEGSISKYHREHGGDLIWQIASGYFGCRNPDGTFSDEKFVENARDPQVKMIELKLSQGAKPGHGGMLLGAKVTPEIAAARGIPVGQDCISPPFHSAFSTPLELMHFIGRLRRLSGGKPVGIKLCIGHPWEWFAMVKAMLETDITPDFIVVDGAEGGTGAAPVEFTDHVGVPLQEGLILVHNTLVGVKLRDRIKIGAAAKVITAFDIARMMALGADWCNAGRGFMLALGCIQALPHRLLPHGGDHARPGAPKSPGCARQSHACGQLSPQYHACADGAGASCRPARTGRNHRPPHRAAHQRCRSAPAFSTYHAGAPRGAAGVVAPPAPRVSPVLAAGQGRQLSDSATTLGALRTQALVGCPSGPTGQNRRVGAVLV